MSKAIKVDDQVYQALDGIREKSQTFSQVVEELLKTRFYVFEILNTLEGQVKYHEYRDKRLKELEAAITRGDS